MYSMFNCWGELFIRIGGEFVELRLKSVYMSDVGIRATLGQHYIVTKLYIRVYVGTRVRVWAMA